MGRESAPLDSINFAKDDKRTKRAARAMLHMVHHINEEHLKDVPDRPEPHVVVRCATCHRGLARPRLLEDTLALVLVDSGSGAAARPDRPVHRRRTRVARRPQELRASRSAGLVAECRTASRCASVS